MKRKNFIFIVLAMAVVLFSAASCNKNDQTWEAMQWKGLNEGAPSNYYSSQMEFDVDAKGGEFDYDCVNYKNIWPSDIEDKTDEANDSVFTYQSAGNGNSSLTLSSHWAEAVCNGSRLHVKIKPNTSGRERTITVAVSAGDVFTSFVFHQKQ